MTRMVAPPVWKPPQHKIRTVPSSRYPQPPSAGRATGGPHVVKVGPKGYIHGWIYVGPQAAGARVFHGGLGHGTVEHHQDGKVHVRFDSGAERSFDAHHNPKAKEHFEQRPAKPDKPHAGAAEDKPGKEVPRDRGRPATEEKALAAAPLRIETASDGNTNIPASGIGGHSRQDVFDALDDYAGRNYKDINGGLRRKRGDAAGLPRKRRDQVERIDAAMEHSKLTHDVRVYRGVKDPKAMFGSAWGDGDLTGLEWVDDGYTSTTAASQMQSKFARKQTSELPVVMHIRVPKGTRAVQLSDMDDEGELLLHRGARFRIVGDDGVVTVGSQQARRLRVEVV